MNMVTEHSNNSESTAPTRAEWLEWIRPIQDPEINMSLVDLGLIYDVNYEISDRSIRVTMSLTTASCPAADYMVLQVKTRFEEHPSVSSAKVDLVFEPKWDPKTMASEEVKEKLGIW